MKNRIWMTQQGSQHWKRNGKFGILKRGFIIYFFVWSDLEPRNCGFFPVPSSKKFGLVSGFQTILELWNPLCQGNGIRSPISERDKKGQLEHKLKWEPGWKVLGKLLLKCCLALWMMGQHKLCLKINGLKPTCICLNNFVFILDLKKIT